MKSSTRLDSVVFQLTPTRTRCDLVITADGKTEKIASGLLNPFLAHLKVAQEQIGKGGYSIILEPNHGSDAAWFSKGTVERFVRFVSTPEILERVYTIESEILQIEEATSFQISNETGLHNVEDHQVKFKEINEGGKPILGNNEEKAIVLYKPDVHPPETEGSTMQEGNSKVQLLKVLGARKRVLQKEQGMAFARAVAAGFDIDHIKPLMSFAECFGASRMMDACSRFIDLWNAKHENGQWLEIEAAEAMSCRSDLPPAHSGIMISNLSDKKKELKESWAQGEASLENNGPSSMTANPDIKPPVGHQVPPHPHEYISDQFSHPMFPSWPINPQANPLPIFLQYPMPMPYYQNYPGNGPLFQPPYPIIDESTLHTGQRMGQRRHSMDNSELSTESETQEVDALKRKMQDDMDKNEEDSRIWEARKKSGKSSQNQSGMVVIRNINYITSKKQSSGGGDSQSSASEAEEDRNLEFSAPADMNKSSPSNSKSKGRNIKSTDALKTLHNENRISGHTTDDSHWEAFQNFLLRDTDEDNNNSSKRGMLAMEGKGQGRKRQSTNGEDPSVLGGRGLDGLQNGRYSESHDISRDITRMLKPTNDEMLTSRRGEDFGHNIRARDAHMDVGLTEMGYHRGACRRIATAGDELMIHEREKLMVVQNLDPLFGNRLDASYNQTRSSTHNTVDESFVVPCRSSSFGQVGGGDDRSAIDVDFELPSLLPGAENHADRTGSQGNYEPNDLNLMPNRLMENFPIGFDPAMDYEKQDFNGNATKVEAKKEVTLNSKRGSRKEDKEHRLKAEKKITATTIKRKPSKLSPSDEARARAERLRAFKADLQKLKKAKEEEQIKRIEDLKIERKKESLPEATQTLLSHLFPHRKPGQQNYPLALTKVQNSVTRSLGHLHLCRDPPLEPRLRHLLILLKPINLAD
ncbi:hypothetical protein Nepgr_030354 [Nepenthes gracilis]|uniref:COP1-interacting protein 7 n=1 Tax=Nepenthes gracilis TaxID=150966 RepID=A0AAD3TG22_NEPGR|nr:hypothetical protein Nepgr_030354 [Nepenthes gracilis]